jgi:tetratricopeptide (TPR) repeat protein
VKETKYSKKIIKLDIKIFKILGNIGRRLGMKNQHILIISLMLIIIFVTLLSSISFSQDKSIEELYFKGVDLLENKGQYEEALTYFQQIIELEPSHAEAHYQMGKIFRITHQFEKAITHYKNAINSKPNYGSAYYGLGLAYLELQKNKEALENFKQAVRIKPDFASAHYGLGIIFLVQGDKNAALGEYKILKDLDQDIADQLFDMIYK